MSASDHKEHAAELAAGVARVESAERIQGPPLKQDAAGPEGSASQRRYSGFNARWAAQQDGVGEEMLTVVTVQPPTPLPTPTVNLICGDVIDVLRDLPPGRVSCVMTSPPYWGLRKYLDFDAVQLRRELDSATRSMVVSRLNGLNILPKR